MNTKTLRLLRARPGHPIGSIVEFSVPKANRLLGVGEAERVPVDVESPVETERKPPTGGKKKPTSKDSKRSKR